MPSIKTITLNKDRSCNKCRGTLPQGTIAVKDSSDKNKGRIYYHTECPKDSDAVTKETSG